MDVIDTAWDGPLPAAEGDYEHFFSSCASGDLVFQECVSCGHRQAYPRAACARCASDVRWIKSAGHGVIHTFTVVRQTRIPPFDGAAPYVVAMVDLDDGVRLMGTVIDCGPDEVEIGRGVVAVARMLSPGLAVPQWRLVG